MNAHIMNSKDIDLMEELELSPRHQFEYKAVFLANRCLNLSEKEVLNKLTVNIKNKDTKSRLKKRLVRYYNIINK